MGKEGRITAHQIAAMLGVSQPTVSRALRGDKKVNEVTRARIVALANELNYSVDHNALRLRTQQTYSIALVILCRRGENKANINPFYLSLLGCIAASASERGYNLIVSFQDSPANFFANYTGSRQADGLIVIGSGQNIEGWQFFGEYARHKTPMICWGASKEDPTRPWRESRLSFCASHCAVDTMMSPLAGTAGRILSAPALSNCH